MARIDPATLSEDEIEAWLVSTVVPRPIAWTATLNEDGTANLAPFSFFTGVSTDPPTCVIAVSKHERDGEPVDKDTRRNIERTREFVVHVVSAALGPEMVATSRGLPYGTDEFELAGLRKLPCERVAVPRIAGAAVAMECALAGLHEVGRDRTALIVGEILLWHVDDGVLEGGRIDFDRLDAIGRMGGPDYVHTRDRLRIKRR